MELHETLDIRDAAKQIGVTTRQAYELVSNDELELRKVEGKYRVPKASVDRLRGDHD